LGKPTNYSNLKIFGYPAYAHVNEEKLEPRAKKCVFVVYLMNVKGYKLWCPSLSKFFISRDVTFDELVMLKAQKVVHPSWLVRIMRKSRKKLVFEISVSYDDEERIIPQEGADLEEEEDQTYSLARSQPRRETWAPERYGFPDFAYCLAIIEEVEFSKLSFYKEAISSKDAMNWVTVMNEEVHSLERNQA
jgi:hypothetical protein